VRPSGPDSEAAAGTTLEKSVRISNAAQTPTLSVDQLQGVLYLANNPNRDPWEDASRHTSRIQSRTVHAVLDERHLLQDVLLLWVDNVGTEKTELLQILRTVGTIVHVTQGSGEAIGFLSAARYDFIIGDIRAFTHPPSDETGISLRDAVKAAGLRADLIAYTRPSEGMPADHDGIRQCTTSPSDLLAAILDTLKCQGWPCV
jgi:hypothetical protein